MKKNYVLDSFALLAYFESEPGAKGIKEILHLAQNKKVKLFLSTVNLGEIFYIVYRRRGEELAEKSLVAIEQLNIELVGVDKSISLLAAKIKAKTNLGYIDSITGALSKLSESVLITGDSDFKKIENEISILWI